MIQKNIVNFFILILLLFLLLQIEIKKEDFKESETSSFQNISYSKDPLIYKEETDFYSIYAEIPSDVDLNEFDIENFIYDDIESFKKEHVFFESENDFLETVSYPWILDIDYEVYKSLLTTSYVFSFYEYTGGAHGNIRFKTLTFFNDTGKLVSLDDIFIVSSKDYLPMFTFAGNHYFSHVFENYFSDGLEPRYENWNLWYIDEDEIVFIFPAYQIAPYAQGEQELRLLLNDFVDQIHGKFLN